MRDVIFIFTSFQIQKKKEKEREERIKESGARCWSYLLAKTKKQRWCRERMRY